MKLVFFISFIMGSYLVFFHNDFWVGIPLMIFGSFFWLYVFMFIIEILPTKKAQQSIEDVRGEKE